MFSRGPRNTILSIPHNTHRLGVVLHKYSTWLYTSQPSKVYPNGFGQGGINPPWPAAASDRPLEPDVRLTAGHDVGSERFESHVA
jgi:hypothetical protein